MLRPKELTNILMPQNHKKRILIVEDDEMIRSFVTIHMENNGFDVSGVSTGKAFFAALEIEPVDLVILDLNLPDGDGLEFAAELRKTDNTPIIIASARKGMDDRLTALNLGSIDYVTKPFDPQELYLRVKNLLDNTENDVASPTTQTRPQNGPNNSQMKYMALGAGAVLALIVIVGVAWNLGRNTSKNTLPNVAQLNAPAPAALPASPLARPPTLVKKTVVEPQPPAKAPPLQKAQAPEECEKVPEISWWSNKSHQSIRLYVERRYAGDWAPYIKSWDRRLEKLVDIMGRNSSAVASSGIVLSGAELGDYIAKVEKRISIVKCLSRKNK